MSAPAASLPLANPRKQRLREEIEASLDEQDRWRKFNAAYHEDDLKFMRFLIPPGKRVLELGCGTGDLLAALAPAYGVGIDFGAKSLARAKQRHPGLNFVLGDLEDRATLDAIEGPFDYIVIADTIGMFEDIDGTLGLVHQLCAPSTRIIISYYSHLWEPILQLAEALGLRRKQPKINYIATTDFLNLMDLADFEVISWSGVAAPGKTPPPVIARLHAEIERALEVPEVRTRLESFGAEVRSTSPAEMRDLVARQIALWTKVANEANIRLD